MKYFVLGVVLALGACTFLTGPEGSPGEGLLIIDLGGAERSAAALPGGMAGELRYVLVFTGPGGEAVTREAKGGESLTLTAALGEWRIEAAAYQEDNPVGQGSTVVTVVEGINAVQVPMTVNQDLIHVRYVTSGGTGAGLSWADASGDIQGMMDELASGAYTGVRIVKAAAGTYTPPVDSTDPRDAAFILREGVQLWGGYPAAGGSVRDVAAHKTVLSGDLNGDDIGTTTNRADNAYHVVLAVNIPPGRGTTLDGLTITGGSADGTATDSITVSGKTIAKNNGGGIYCHEASPVLTGVTISDNKATGPGGGMYNGDNSSPVLTNVTISGNTANNGGGMYNNASSLILTNVTISTNTALGNGGGIYNGDNSSPDLTGVTISSNIAADGGGMYNNASSPILTNVTISDNAANGYGANDGGGGGMYNTTTSSPVLNNVTISGNTADTGGGMANYAASSPVLTNVTVSGNTALGSGGGGMYNDISSPVLTDVTISDNIVTVNGYGYGGGMYNDISSPVLTNVTISGNAVNVTGNDSFGGGMYNKDSSPVLTGVTISGNTITHTGYGNSHGGGMFNKDSSPVLIGVRISGNAAKGANNSHGGGMRNDGGAPVLINVTITGNAAAGGSGGNSHGGGMYNSDYSSPVLTNVTIAGNTAGNTIYSHGGGMLNQDSSLEVRNSIIWGNTAANSPGIKITTSTLEFAYSIVELSGGSDAWETSVAGTDRGSNRDVDPLFIDPAAAGSPTTAGDYGLKPGSPAIDAGDYFLYPDTWTTWQNQIGGVIDEEGYNRYIKPYIGKDLAGNPRIRDIIDMGAYETQ